MILKLLVYTLNIECIDICRLSPSNGVYETMQNITLVACPTMVV